jgi:hypothetical protein
MSSGFSPHQMIKSFVLKSWAGAGTFSTNSAISGRLFAQAFKASLTGSREGENDTLTGCGEGGMVALGGVLQAANHGINKSTTDLFAVRVMDYQRIK